MKYEDMIGSGIPPSSNNAEEVEMQSFVSTDPTITSASSTSPINNNNHTNGVRKRISWDAGASGLTHPHRNDSPVEADLTDLLRRHYNYQAPPIFPPPVRSSYSWWRQRRQKILSAIAIFIVLVGILSIIGSKGKNSSLVHDTDERYGSEDNIMKGGTKNDDGHDIQISSPMEQNLVGRNNNNYGNEDSKDGIDGNKVETTSPKSTPITSAIWKQQEYAIINGDTKDAMFGRSIALSADGTIMAIGAPYSNTEGIESGEVKVYRRSRQQHQSNSTESESSNIGWEQLGQSVYAEGEYNHLGYSVALSSDGKILAVGAPSFWDKSRPGYAKVYHLTGDEERWERRGEAIYGDEQNDSTGWSVALSSDGTVLAVGSPWNHMNGKDSGMVKVYRWDESYLDYRPLVLSYIFEARSDPNDEFGSSVSLSGNGDILAIGSPGTKDGKSGYVNVYRWDKEGMKFQRRGLDKAIHGKEDNDSMGFALALSEDGNTLAVGAPGKSTKPGYVGVYRWDDTISNYKQLGNYIVGTDAGERLGRSVAISANGDIIAVGAPWHGYKASGRVRAYRWDEASASYSQLGQAIDGMADDDFMGQSVALSLDGKTLSVGATGNSDNGKNSGQVKVYNIEY